MRQALLFIIFIFMAHQNIAQPMTESPTNPLLCDLHTGTCTTALPDNAIAENVTIDTQEKEIHIIYYTDPICSSCWAIEPALRRLKAEYGHAVSIEYRMGGLLPDWSYNSGGISKPSDVAHHWDEVSLHYDMPIDGDVWLEDPLPSSYPPSIAFKAAQLQDEHKAIIFLRTIREMVFLQKKNITKWEHLAHAATYAGLDTAQLRKDYEGKAVALFEDDLKWGKQLRVRGFPTLICINQSGKQEVIYGSRPYTTFVETINKLNPHITPRAYAQDYKQLFSKFNTLTALEYATLTGLERQAAEKHLNEWTSQGSLMKFETKNGSIWKLKQ